MNRYANGVVLHKVIGCILVSVLSKDKSILNCKVIAINFIYWLVGVGTIVMRCNIDYELCSCLLMGLKDKLGLCY